MVTTRCAHCGAPFQPRPQTPKQTFCSAPACQRARKRQWQQAKLASDPDYRANQRSAQRAWAARNRGYWPQWRQAQRASAPVNRAHYPRTDSPAWADTSIAVPVKMDTWIPPPSGLFQLTKLPNFPGETSLSWVVAIVPVDVSPPVKMDV